MYLKILKNAGFLVFVRLAQPLFSLLLIIYIARSRGTELLGGYIIVLSYLVIFHTIASFGFKYLLTREVAKKPDSSGKLFFHASIFSIPLGIVCAFIMYGTTAILGYESIIQLSIGIAGIALIPAALIENCEGIFIGLENIKPYSIACFFENLIRLILSIYAIESGYGLVEIIAIFTITRFMGLGVNLLILRKKLFSTSLQINFSFSLHLLKLAKTFAFIVILAAIYSRADVLILSKFSGTADVGIYSAAFRFIAAAQLLIASFGNALYPQLTKIYQQKFNQFRTMCTEVIRRLFITVVPFVILVSLSAEHIIMFLFGSEFEGSIIVLQILIISLLPFAVIGVGDYILLSSHNQRLDLKINLYAVICIIGLNFMLIPTFGTTGAAVAMVLSTIIYLIVQYHFLSRYVFRINLLTIFKNPSIAGIVMVIPFLIIKNTHITLAVIVSSAIYIIGLLSTEKLLKKNTV